MTAPSFITLEQHPNHNTIFIKNHGKQLQIVWMTIFLLIWCNIFYQFLLPLFTKCGWRLEELLKTEGSIMFLVLVISWILAALSQLHTILYLLFGGKIIEVSAKQIRIRKRWHLLDYVMKYDPEQMQNISVGRPHPEDVLKKMPIFISRSAPNFIYFDYRGQKDRVLLHKPLSYNACEYILKNLLDLGVLKKSQLAEYV